MAKLMKIADIFAEIVGFIMIVVFGVWGINFMITGTSTIEDSILVFYLGWFLILLVPILFLAFIFFSVGAVILTIIDLIERKGE